MRALLYSLARAPLFLGATRALDLTGALNEPMPYEGVRNGPDADAYVLHRDWMAVGDDIRSAITQTARIDHDS